MQGLNDIEKEIEALPPEIRALFATKQLIDSLQPLANIISYALHTDPKAVSFLWFPVIDTGPEKKHFRVILQKLGGELPDAEFEVDEQWRPKSEREI